MPFDGSEFWLTPPDLMDAMDAEFAFDFDPCPFPKPDDFDGLTVPWGQSNYVNPPFKGPTAWVRKAIAENQRGKRVVFVFPVDKWVLMLLAAGAKVRNLGRREVGLDRERATEQGHGPSHRAVHPRRARDADRADATLRTAQRLASATDR